MPITRPVPARRVARWSLLFAALLHIAAGAVGLRAHLGIPAVLSAVAAEQGSTPRDADPRPVPHNEQACVACQSLEGAALPPLPASLSAAGEVRAAPAADPAILLAHRTDGPQRARAPPLA
jgi:hypothetical protein